ELKFRLDSIDWVPPCRNFRLISVDSCAVPVVSDSLDFGTGPLAVVFDSRRFAAGSGAVILSPKDGRLNKTHKSQLPNRATSSSWNTRYPVVNRSLLRPRELSRALTGNLAAEAALVLNRSAAALECSRKLIQAL